LITSIFLTIEFYIKTFIFRGIVFFVCIWVRQGALEAEVMVFGCVFIQITEIHAEDIELHITEFSFGGCKLLFHFVAFVTKCVYSH